MPRTASKSNAAAAPKKTNKVTGSKGTSKSAGRSAGKSAQSASQDSSMLKEFFTDSLKDIYWAEKALLKALPKMQKNSTTEELKQAFMDHTEVTREQVTRLEQVFETIGEKAQGKKCEAMAGLIKEAESIIEDTEKGTVTRDVGLIMAAQKAEHYEIATYGGLAQLARTLGLNDAAELLDQTLQEEKETDQLLTAIAENNINIEAASEEEED